MSALDNFCIGEFWNTTLFLDNTWPELTTCFRLTILLWVPCGFLWLSSLIYIPYIVLQPRRRHIPFTVLNFLKTSCSGILLTVAFVGWARVGQEGANKEPGGAVLTLQYAIRTSTFLLTIVLMQIDRKRGVHTSAILFLFWLLILLASIIPAYTFIIQKVYTTDIMKFCFFFFQFLTLIAQFILHWFSDIPNSDDLHEENQCPETLASFPSRVVMWWMTGLIVRGFRKTLEIRDVWKLNPRDTCDKLVPRFEIEWEREKKSALKRNDISKSKRKILFINSKVFEGSSGRKPYPTEKTSLLSSQSSGGSRTSKTSCCYVENVESGESEDETCEKPSMFTVLMKLFGKQLFIVCALKLIGDVMTVGGPVILSELIILISNKTATNIWRGYALAVMLFVVQVVSSVFVQAGLRRSYVFGLQVKTVCVQAIYKKTLTLSNAEKKSATTGEILNRMSVDCQRIADATTSFTFVCPVPLQIVLSVVLLYQTIGAAVFAGFVFLIVLLPLSAFVSAKVKNVKAEHFKQKDKRMKLLNEIIGGIKVLKLYAWETAFKEKVEEIRKKEIKLLLKMAYMLVVTNTSMVLASFLVSLVTFATYVLIDPSNQLDANKAFVTLSLFNILRVPMNMLPVAYTSVFQAWLSLKRLNSFLCRADLDPQAVHYDRQSDYAVQIRQGIFTWDRSVSDTLKNINLNVPKGTLVAVVGQVASGKSSLLSAILGEMEKISGNVTVQSSTAYVPQQAWIQNCTLRDNILFGRKFRPKKYKAVLRACELNPDLSLLSAGDMTEIGEKGINLSGGQKQRVSLARAVYSNSDIYLLDDPLSAVDSHVGKQLFKNIIGSRGLLNRKTRILVTHGIHWLPLVDQVIVMKDGHIAETGTYEELVTQEGHFAEFLKEYLIQAEIEEDEDEEVRAIRDRMRAQLDSLTSSCLSSDDGLFRRRRYTESLHGKSSSTRSLVQSTLDNKQGAGRLTEEETLGDGKVKNSVFLTYFRAAGLTAFLLICSIFVVYQIINVYASFYLTSWTTYNITGLSEREISTTNYTHLRIYAAYGLAMLIVVPSHLLLLSVRMIRAAARLYSGIFNSILRCPMSFFETTPHGRIINRMSRDIDVVDEYLQATVRMAVGTLVTIVTTLVIITINTASFLYVLVPLVIFYTIIQKLYIPTIRQLRRIESVTRSPVYEHFSETINGSSSIRAYRAVNRFLQESQRRLDKNQVFFYAGAMANRWLAFYLDIIGSVIISSSAIFAVANPYSTGGTIGLSVSYALPLSLLLSWMVRQFSEMETSIVSVERIKEFTDIKPEADWIVPDNRPPWDWPESGRVEMCGYMTQYRPGLDMALKGINCTIEPGEKVGIVGRTGAGKSSLTLALFRVLEAAGGCIRIDGIDISQIGLHDLRSRLTILPQDPVLFSGTLRMNLDPFHESEDHEIWQTLERSHLKKFVLEARGHLMFECGEGGSNLSVGQRQLVCLARALLRHTKILILDEATAAVDMETDSLIQNTIRVEFEQCTVISIAHRLNTVMDYDRIIVMENGHIKEFASPGELLRDSESLFYSMAKSSGLL